MSGCYRFRSEEKSYVAISHFLVIEKVDFDVQ